jgi:hypothetical protein
VILGSNNIIRANVLKNMTRQRLGCGVQLQGSSRNVVRVNAVLNSGANGLDLNQQVSDGSVNYPDDETAPITQPDGPIVCSHNTISIAQIDGTGVYNADTVEQNEYDDDYYGVNLINGANNNSIFVDSIRNVRAGTPDTYASVVRIGECSNNVIDIKGVDNVKRFFRLGNYTTTGPQNNIIRLVEISPPSIEYWYKDAQMHPSSKVILVAPQFTGESRNCYNDKLWYGVVTGTNTKGDISGWSVPTTMTLSEPTSNELQITASGDGKYLEQQFRCDSPFVLCEIEYKLDSGNAKLESSYTPFFKVELDSNTWTRQLCVLLPNTDSETYRPRLRINTGVLNVRQIRFFDCAGRPIASTTPQLNSEPLNNEKNLGDRVYNRNTIELGTASAKYVVLGWSFQVGVGWLENRVMTGN